MVKPMAIFKSDSNKIKEISFFIENDTPKMLLTISTCENTEELTIFLKSSLRINEFASPIKFNFDVTRKEANTLLISGNLFNAISFLSSKGFISDVLKNKINGTDEIELKPLLESSKAFVIPEEEPYVPATTVAFKK